MEFILTTDLSTALPAEIGFNFGELKTELAERLAYYNGLIVTEDTIKDAKSDRAKLNKLLEAIETRRKEVKKLVLAPYNDFEARVKELTGMVREPIAAIDGQLKIFEEMRKAERRAAIEAMYAEIVPETLQDIIPAEKVIDPKWLNASTTIKSIGEDLTALVKRTNADMLVLDTVEPEHAVAVREVYVRTHDIEKAMAHRKALQDAAAAFRAREEAKAAREAQDAAEANVASVAAPAEEEPQEERLYALRLEMHLTKAQAAALKRFLAAEGIDYIKI